MKNANQYDAIIVGSGTCGATVARELARRNKKVLMLEQGESTPLREKLSMILSVTREHTLGHGLKAATAVTVGGSTSLYFGVCKLPTAETFRSLGIDFSAEVAEVRAELPIAELSDEFLAPQSIKVRDSARELGYTFKKNLMLIDQSKCAPGEYSYDARWRARTFVDDAIEHGATLVTRATVQSVIVENGRAVGVEYRQKTGLLRSQVHRVYAKKIVLSAGSLATPKLLFDCGIKDIGDRGFFCKPAYMVCGIVPGMKARDAFVGNQDIELPSGVSVGDGAMNSFLFKLVMLANFKLKHLFSFSRIVSLGILIYDSMGGYVRRDGGYHKRLTVEEMQKLDAAEGVAVSILKNAGAQGIFRTKLMAGIPGGVLRIHEHLDENLQTKIRNLYVCDHSVMSDVKITPTFTLICLAKRLAKHLAAAQPNTRSVNIRPVETEVENVAVVA